MIVAVVLLIAGFLSLVALAPTLVSSGLFRGRIIEAVGGSVNGTVSIGQVSVGWSGPLSARGVTIEDTATGNRLAADISLEQGLWTLITKGAERLDVRLSGSLRTRREADGSLSILKLLREAPAPPSGAAVPAPAASRAGRPGLPRGIAHVAVTIDDLDLEVVEAGGETSLAVRDGCGHGVRKIPQPDARGVDRPQRHPPALEPAVRVVRERGGHVPRVRKQARADECLEPVADPEDRGP